MSKLGNICSIQMGQSPELSTYNTEGYGLPFFQENADFGKKNPTVRIWCNEPKKMAKPQDILISVRAPIGALNVADVECCIVARSAGGSSLRRSNWCELPLSTPLTSPSKSTCAHLSGKRKIK